MSTDYFYICPDLKLYMPAFSFQMRGLWHAHFDGLLEWTSLTTGKEVQLIMEQTIEWDKIYDEDWGYINPYERPK